MRTLAAVLLIALLVPTGALARCQSNTLDDAGYCKGARRSGAPEPTIPAKGSDIARDPYAHTRAERTDHGPLVRRVFAAVTGVAPQRSIERYYVMRMDGGWTEPRLEADIRRRYGERAGTVAVGPLEKDAARDADAERADDGEPQ
jgi:hypothetical protein